MANKHKDEGVSEYLKMKALNKKRMSMKGKEVCPICQKKFYTPGGFDHHMAVHNGLKRDFQCDQCGKAYNTQSLLKIHKRTVHEGIYIKNHQCHSCDKRFQTPSQLKNHIKFQHDKIFDVVCDLCGKAYASDEGLKIHVQNVHEGKYRQKCHVCGKSYCSKNALNLHMKAVHQNVRDFKCFECDQAFKRINHLQNHLDKIHKIEISCKELSIQIKINDKSKVIRENK